jgi:hypothetical protein
MSICSCHIRCRCKVACGLDRDVRHFEDGRVLGTARASVGVPVSGDIAVLTIV